jgi:solute carrier family 35 protein F5
MAAPKRLLFSVVGRFSVGLVLILIVALIWVVASKLVQYIFSSSFDAPFFLTYTCNSLFVVYLPIVGVGDLVRATLGHRDAAERPLAVVVDGGELSESMGLVGSSAADERNAVAASVVARSARRISAEGDSPFQSSAAAAVAEGDEAGPARMSFGATLLASAVVCPIWFFANFTYNFSLKWTSISSNTILSSTSSIWTFLLSVIVLRESVTPSKLVGIALAVLGSSCVGVSSSAGSGAHAGEASSTLERVAGGAIALFGACLYGCYTTAIRHMLPDERTARMPLFFGLIGALNAAIFFPVVVMLHFTGVESLTALSASTLGMIVLKGLADNVVSDLLWAYAVVLTTPTVATLGVSLTIPGAIALDTLLGNPPQSPMLYAGAILVIAGFVSVNAAAASWPRGERWAWGRSCFAAFNAPLSLARMRTWCCSSGGVDGEGDGGDEGGGDGGDGNGGDPAAVAAREARGDAVC